MQRQWSPIEIFVILDLTIHKDVIDIYNEFPSLDASLLTGQDWESIAEWMTQHFKHVQSYRFSNNKKPDLPYNSNEIKQCAKNILIKHSNNNIIPKQFNKLINICQNAKKYYNQQIINKLIEKEKHLNNQLNQLKLLKNQNNIKKSNPHIIPSIPAININSLNNKFPPTTLPAHLKLPNITSIVPKYSNIPPLPLLTNKLQSFSPKNNVKKQTKTDEDKCKSHILSMLDKLWTYNNDTKRQMSAKLEAKFRTLQEQAIAKCDTLNYPMDKKAIAIQEEKKNLDINKQKEWTSYEGQIREKVRQSFQGNIAKLKNKFSQYLVENAMPKVKEEMKYPLFCGLFSEYR